MPLSKGALASTIEKTNRWPTEFLWAIGVGSIGGLAKGVAQVPFVADQKLGEAGRVFGEYLTTFTSRTGQVRADLFRVGSVVNAHVSFPTGLNATSVTDPYLSELRSYAQKQGFTGKLRLIYS